MAPGAGAIMPDTPVDTAPPNRELEFRVSRLEQDMGDVKSILGQMLPMLVRIDATLTTTLPHLATKAELQSAISGVESKIGGVESKIGGVESKIGGVESKISGVESKISGVESKISGVESKISGVESKISEMRAEMRAELADKPGKTYIWMVLGVLIMAYTAGLAGLAVLK
jgi:septal ring factor EnvC (AmiA/AmiB activator)